MLLEKGDREDRWVCLLMTIMTTLEGTRGLFYLYAAKLWGPGDRKISRKLSRLPLNISNTSALSRAY